MTVYAIASIIGHSATGVTDALIEACEDEQYLGSVWAVWGDHSPQSGLHVVSFEPQDQFCHIIPLETIKKQLSH